MRRETGVLFVLRSILPLVVLFGAASIQAQPAYNFLPEVRVNQDTPGVGVHVMGLPNGHCIGSFMGNPVIVWYGGPGYNDRHIYFSRSVDRGSSFLPPVRLDSSPMLKAYDDPTLLCANGDIFVSWTDSSPGAWHLYLTRSTDGGNAFGPKIGLGDSNGGLDANFPSLAVDNQDNLYCTWTGVSRTDPNYPAIYLARSTDLGKSFGPSIVVFDSAPLRAVFSSIGADSSGGIYLAWPDDRTDPVHEHDHIYFVKSTDGGSSFTPAVRVDTPTGGWPSLAVDDAGQHVMVAHSETSGIFSARSTDGGSTFSLVGPLNSDSGSVWPNLASPDSLHAYLVWFSEGHTIMMGNVYLSYSTDGGSSFSEGQRVNTDFDSASSEGGPHVALGQGDTVFVCWPDGRRCGDSAPDLYFTKGYPSAGGLTEVGFKARLQMQVRATPSPARDVVRFTLLADRPTSITLEVSDVCGRILKQFRDIEVSSGLPRYVEWNTRDAQSKVPTGIYFYRWYAGSGSSPSASQTGRFCLVQSH